MGCQKYVYRVVDSVMSLNGEDDLGVIVGRGGGEAVTGEINSSR
jgi:hypothetical protein